MFKLAIVAAILPAAAWWWTFDLPSASGLAEIGRLLGVTFK
jgi:hypothetical protein